MYALAETLWVKAPTTSGSPGFHTEAPAAPGADQQPAAGRLPVPSQHGVPVPGQDVTGRQPGYRIDRV